MRVVMAFFPQSTSEFGTYAQVKKFAFHAFSSRFFYFSCFDVCQNGALRISRIFTVYFLCRALLAPLGIATFHSQPTALACKTMEASKQTQTKHLPYRLLKPFISL